MRISTIKTLIASTMLAAMAALPAQAQTVGAGLSFLEGATGVTLDYAKANGSTPGGRARSWVGDFSFHHEGAGSDLIGTEVSANIITVMGGLRMQGSGGERLRWLVQGLAGIMRSSVNVSAAGLTEDICEAFDLDCDAGAANTGFVVTPGAAIEYILSERRALRVQLDLPIGEGGLSSRFWIGLAMMLN